MKKIKIGVITLGILLVALVIVNYGNRLNGDQMILNDGPIDKSYSSGISMMYETANGSGIYEESKDSLWPQKDYVFNSTLSKCENGSTLSWNDETKKIIMAGNVSDKCYVYFDAKFEPSAIKSVTSSYAEEIWQYKSSITKIEFESTLTPHNGYAYKFDISEDGRGSVMAYMMDNGDNTYTTYIQSDGKVKLNPNSSNLFYNFSNLQSIDGTDNLDTSKVTNMFAMFSGCSSLTYLDVSKWDTSNVTRLSSMFYNCKKLTSLNLSSWDTSNVTEMGSMFNYCINITSFGDISSWNTSRVTKMSAMFQWCINIESLDLSGWDTSNVTSMESMFNMYGNESGSKLNSIVGISNWDTSRVTATASMFAGCNNLTNLNLSGWDTSNVTRLSSMFNGCSKLINIDFRNATFTSVTSYPSMFKLVPSTIQVIVKDADAKTFIDARLKEANGGTAVIA